MGDPGSGSDPVGGGRPGEAPDASEVAAPDSSTARLRTRPWGGRARAAGATLTLLIAVWGAVTGTAAWLDSRRVALRISPAPYPATPSSRPIEVALVNRSHRGVALVAGRVLMDGEEVGEVDAVVPDVPLDWRLRPLEELAEKLRPLPVTIEPSQSMTAAFSWRPTSERASERISRRLDVKPDPEVPGSTKPRLPVAVRLELELEFDPGGTRIARIGVVRPRQALGPPDLAVLVRLRRGRVVGIVASRGPDDEPAIGVLRVWSERSTVPVRTATRPLGPPGPTLFPLRLLPPGRYTWSITVARETVTGRLLTPCKPSRDFRGEPSVPIEECQPAVGLPPFIP